MMKKSLLLILILALCRALVAQTPQFSITPSGNLTVCDGSVVNVNANVTNAFASTNDYAISTIPFAPYNTNFGTAVNLVDDAISPALPIGFAFCFFGNTYTQFYIGSNGWIGFSPGQTMAFTAATIPSTSWLVPRNCIMGPWMDWNPGIGPNVGNYIRYQTQGIAPFRRLVVTWTNTPLYQCTALNGTIQIVIYESTNIIENFITNKPVCMAWAGGTATQGLHNATGTTAIVVPGRNATVWTANNDARRYTPSGPPNFTVTWLANGIPVGTGNSISHLVNGPTQLIGRVNFNCSNLVLFDTLNIGIGSTVNANFAVSNPATGNACAGQPVTFTYTGNAPPTASFTWTFAGGTPANATGIGPHTVTFASAGNYSPSLSVSQNACGSGNFTLPITIGAPVSSTFTASGPVCIGQNSTITYTGNAPVGATYNWNFAGGTVVSGSGQGPYQVNWATSGPKNITLSVSNGGCTSVTTTVAVNVNPIPTSTFTASGPVCVGQNSTITYTGSAPAGATYNWNFAGGTIISGTGQGPYQISWATPGARNITLSVTQNGCTSTVTSQTVTVNPVPTNTFTLPSTICLGQAATISYTGNAPTGATYNWNFAGGTIVSGSGQGPYQISWATPGVRNVTLTVNNGGCTSTLSSQNINVQNAPTSAFTVTSPICQNANSTVTYTGNAPAGATYNWNFGGGTIVSGSGQGPYQISWPNSGTQIVSLTVTQGNCTSPLTTQNITVNPLPNASFTATPTVGVNSPATITYTGGAGPGATYTWNFSGGNIISGSGQGPYQVSWPTTGPRTITLTVTLNGCTATFTQNVNVVPSPSSAFTVTSPVCVGQTSTITYTGSAPAGATYNWNFDGGTIVSGSGQGPYQISWNTAGTKNISLQVIQGGISSTITTNQVVVNPIPTSTFTLPATACQNSAVAISYSGSAGAGATYNWNFGGGTIISGTGQGPYQVSWPTAGNRTVSLTVIQNGCTSAPSNQNINILPLPNANFTAVSPVCQGFVSTINYTGGAAAGATFNWNFDGGTIVSGTGAGPYLVNWNTIGNKNITLTVTQNGCTSPPFTQTVNVTNTPIASFSMTPNVVCQGVPVNFNFTGTAPVGATYNWNFGEGTIISGNGPGPYQVVFNNAGPQAVFLSVTSNGCTSPSVSQSFNVTPSPTASFDIAPQVCTGDNASLTFTGNASTGAIFNWNFGGAIVVSGTGAGPYNLQFPNAGSETITLNLSEGSCATPPFSQTVQALDPPTVQIDMANLGCTGELIQIQYTGNAGSGASFNWDFDGAQIISGSGPGPLQVVWNSPGDFNVSLSVEENGCPSATVTSTIQINQLPLFEIIAPAIAISGNSVSLMYGGVPPANANYVWDIENGNPATANGQGPIDVVWTTGGDQTVSLTVSVPGCATVAMQTPVTVLTGADVAFSMPQTVCENEMVTIQFTGQADASASFTWDFDGGTIISGSGEGPFTIIWGQPGTKNVTCQVTQFGIVSPIVAQSIIVNPIPTAFFNVSGLICSGQQVNLQYNGNATPAANYAWNFGNAQVVNNSNTAVQLLFPNSGIYSISLSVEENGCISDPYVLNIPVQPTPIAEFEMDSVLCENAQAIVIFTGSGAANATYQWDFAGSQILAGSGQGDYVIRWENAGQYELSLVINQHGCVSDTFFYNVTVNPNPVASFTLPSAVCVNEPFEVIFNGEASAAATFNWNFGGLNVLSGSGAGPYMLSSATPGSNTINLSISDLNCPSNLATSSVTIHDFPLASITYNGPAFENNPVSIQFNGSAQPQAQFSWNSPSATLIQGNSNSDIEISYASTGFYPVVLSIDQNGCIHTSDTLWVEVLPMPNAAIIGENAICSMNDLQLSYQGNATANAVFHWDFDGATVVSGQGAGPYELMWATPGNKTVTVYIVENGMESNIASHLVMVNLTPTAAFVMNDEACMHQQILVQYAGNGGANATYTWNFDGADIIAGAGMGPYDISFASAGMKAVSLQVSNGLCTSLAFIDSILIHHAPTASFIIPEQTCRNANVQLIYNGNAGSNATFLWNIDGNIQTVVPGQNQPLINWNEAGNKNISLTVIENGCSSLPQNNNIMVRALPNVNAGQDIQFCTGTPAQFNAVAEPGMTYTWSPGNYVMNVNDPNSGINYVGPHMNLYEQSYVLAGNDGFCTGFDTVHVRAVPTPVAHFPTPQPRCMNEQGINFQAGGLFMPNASFQWNFGPNVSTHIPTEKNPQNINFTTPGTHPISLLISQMGCISEIYTDSVVIHDIPLPRFAENNTKGCEPLLVSFMGEETQENLIYSWNFGNGQTANGQTVQHTYSHSGNGSMTVSLTVTDQNGCSNTLTKPELVNVYPKPYADFKINPSMIFLGNEVSVISLSQGGSNCLYIMNGQDSVYTCNTWYSFPNTGENTVELQVSNEFGCLDTAIKSISVDYGSDYFIPAAFSPNFDGLNDNFVIVAEGASDFSMIIFDRWGQEIFKTNDMNKGWDGRIGNSVLPAPLGIYTYLMTFKTKNNVPREVRGTVTLFR
ncbi:MAG: PKD domain-containing protein [Flavobacteriales bacterium]